MKLTPINQNEILVEITEDGEYHVNLQNVFLSMENDFIATIGVVDFEKNALDETQNDAYSLVFHENSETQTENESNEMFPNVSMGSNMYATSIYYRDNKKSKWAIVKLPLRTTLAMELTVHQFNRSK